MIGDTSFWSGIGWTALTSLLTSAVVTGLLQVALKARYDAKLADRVADLGRQNSTDLARLTSELSRDSTREIERFKQRFTLLATQQTQAALTLAEHLAAADFAARRLVMPGSSSTQAAKLLSECEDARFAAMAFIDAKRLLFPPDIGHLADGIIARIARSEGAKQVLMMTDPPTPAVRAMMRDAWAEQSGPGAVALSEMHDRLRDLLQSSTI